MTPLTFEKRNPATLESMTRENSLQNERKILFTPCRTVLTKGRKRGGGGGGSEVSSGRRKMSSKGITEIQAGIKNSRKKKCG